MTDAAEFYVYENWRAHRHRATVHLADCGHCNHGRGKHPNASEDNGRWLGPFGTLHQALNSAQDTGGTVRRCQHCLPQEP